MTLRVRSAQTETLKGLDRPVFGLLLLYPVLRRALGEDVDDPVQNRQQRAPAVSVVAGHLDAGKEDRHAVKQREPACAPMHTVLGFQFCDDYQILTRRGSAAAELQKRIIPVHFRAFCVL